MVIFQKIKPKPVRLATGESGSETAEAAASGPAGDSTGSGSVAAGLRRRYTMRLTT